jgi:hypothetical protein
MSSTSRPSLPPVATRPAYEVWYLGAGQQQWQCAGTVVTVAEATARASEIRSSSSLCRRDAEVAILRVDRSFVPLA